MMPDCWLMRLNSHTSHPCSDRGSTIIDNCTRFTSFVPPVCRFCVIRGEHAVGGRLTDAVLRLLHLCLLLQLFELLLSFVGPPRFRQQLAAAIPQMTYVAIAYLQMTQVSTSANSPAAHLQFIRLDSPCANVHVLQPAGCDLARPTAPAVLSLPCMHHAVLAVKLG